MSMENIVKKLIFRLMDDACKKRGFQRENWCFIFNGKIVLETDTPRSIGMKESDNIDMYEW